MSRSGRNNRICRTGRVDCLFRRTSCRRGRTVVSGWTFSALDSQEAGSFAAVEFSDLAWPEQVWSSVDSPTLLSRKMFEYRPGGI